MELNAHEVLAKLRELPVATWTYEWDSDDVVHLGPMAQDFAAAFGLGESDKVIAYVDYLGVLVVSIQVLALRVEELEHQLADVSQRCSRDGRTGE